MPSYKVDRLGRVTCTDAASGQFEESPARTLYRVARARDLLDQLEAIVLRIDREGVWTADDGIRLARLRQNIVGLAETVQREEIAKALAQTSGDAHETNPLPTPAACAA